MVDEKMKSFYKELEERKKYLVKKYGKNRQIMNGYIIKKN